MKKWLIIPVGLIFISLAAMPFILADEDGHSAGEKEEHGHSAGEKEEDGHAAGLKKEDGHSESLKKEDGHSAGVKEEHGHAAGVKEEDGHSASPKNELAQLKAAVENLTARLAVLETLKPSFAAFMPDFSERFHVMHRAGDAGDWAVAGHELLELKRMVKIAKLIDPVKGQMMQAFMGLQMEKIEGAIEHGNRKTFLGVLVNTVKSCNACHTAVGSPFIKVALDARQYMTMRHSHILEKSKGMKKHAH